MHPFLPRLIPHLRSQLTLCLIFVAFTQAPGAPVVTRGPYLQKATPDSLVIRWRTDVATDSAVRFSTDATNLNNAATDAVNTTEHEVPLQGLAPDTQYFYSVGTSTAPLTSDYSFFTPPPVGSTQPTRIWVIGDSGTANANAAAVRDAYLAYTGLVNTDLWLMLGDNAYNNGTDAEYQAGVFNMYPSILRETALWSTLGNHDYYTANGAPYFQIFNLPTTGEAGGVASGTEKYYSFDHGNIHFVCLDSMSSDRSSTGSMATWLQADLESTLQQWIVAFWHHPPYTKGSHDSDTEIELKEMRTNFLPLLEAGGVDLVLGGHSHSYERSYFINGHYGLSGTLTPAMKLDGGDGREGSSGVYRKPADQGAVYAVAGSSGKATNWWGGSTADTNPNPHPVMFASLLRLGSLVIDVSGPRMDVKFLRSTGSVDDYFSIVKNQPPTVNLTSPAEGASFVAPASITVTAEATAANGGTITQVSFYVSDTLIGTTTSAPYGVTWSNDVAGSYALTAQATDNLGTTVTSAPVNITVTVPPNRPPTVSLTEPVEGAAFNNAEAIPLRALASDNDGTVTQVSFYAGATLIATDTTAPFEATWNLPPGGAHVLTAAATDNGSATTISDPVNITVTQPAPPAPPEGLTATAGEAQVMLVWSASARATSYHVKRATSIGGTYAIIAPAVTGTSFVDGSAANGTNYFYVVSAVNADGESENSAPASATPVFPAPGGLTARALSRTQINLVWTDNSSRETGFRIEQSTKGIFFTEIAVVGANVTSFTKQSLKSNKTYYYRVRAYDAASNSGYSNTASTKTPR